MSGRIWSVREDGCSFSSRMDTGLVERLLDFTYSKMELLMCVRLSGEMLYETCSLKQELGGKNHVVAGVMKLFWTLSERELNRTWELLELGC